MGKFGPSNNIYVVAYLHVQVSLYRDSCKCVDNGGNLYK